MAGILAGLSLVPSSKDEVAKWFSAHSIDLKTEKGVRR